MVSNNSMEYSNKTKSELLNLCMEKGIKGCNNKKKDDIIKLLENKPVLQKAKVKKPCLAPVEKEVQEISPKINTEEIKIDQSDYLKKTREELIGFCKEKNIKGYSGKKKEDIIKLLSSSSHVVTYSSKCDDTARQEKTVSSINEIITPVYNIIESVTNNKTLKVGTLFSGIGAFEHALDRLNINHKIMFACDIDDYVKKSYFANYDIDEDHWYTDVTQLNATKYLDENIDIVVGGSPCQSFSFVGKQKGLEDERGNLIFEFIRVINECKPKVFIFENVKGLTTHDKGKTFEIVINKFKELNYNLHYDILKATDYEIPQSRQRLFLIGVKKDSDVKIAFPPKKCELTHKMSDFLEDNVNTKYYVEEKGQHFAVSDKNLSKKYTQINGKIALCQKKNQQFNWHGDFIFEYRDIPDKYYLSDKVKEYVLKSGTKDFKTKPETDLDIARPLLSSMHKMHRAGVDNYVTKYGKLRKLTPRECLRLMGFSDNFKIIVSDTRMYQQAGNSIVVNVLMSIIKNIDNLY
jgi:DNA (cytosine-5)-methyltransferase 1